MPIKIIYSMEANAPATQIEIQLATSKHLEPVVQIIRGTAKWLKTKGINQWNENFPVSRLEEEVLKGELYVVLDSAHQVVGTISLSRNKGELWPGEDSSAIYLNRIAIARKCAGLNLGSRIIGWAEEYCRQRNVSFIRLNCDKTNPFLPNFYRRCGFDYVGEFFFGPWNMTFSLYELRVLRVQD